MAGKKSTQLVIIGACVFLIGAGLVFVGLRSSGGDDNKTAARTPAVTQTTTATDSTTSVTQVSAAGQSGVPIAVPIPKGKQAVAVKLDRVAGLAGYAKPGDLVNLYATVKAEGTRDQSLTAPWTKLVLSNVQVLDVSGVVPGTEGDATFLLALDAKQAETVIFFAKFESLWAT